MNKQIKRVTERSTRYAKQVERSDRVDVENYSLKRIKIPPSKVHGNMSYIHNNELGSLYRKMFCQIICSCEHVSAENMAQS